jgi:hypothetical protein
MKHLIVFWYGVLFLLFIVGCKDNIASSPPRIEVLSPEKGKTFQMGDTFRVRAVITHEDQLHDLQLRVRNLDTGIDLLSRSYHRHVTRLELTDFIVLTDPDLRKLELYLYASDHNELGSVHQDTFRVKP